MTTMYAERESATFPWWIVLLEGLLQSSSSASRSQPRPRRRSQLPPPSSPEPGYMAELERLAQLRDQRILSEEELEAKKKQVLGI